MKLIVGNQKTTLNRDAVLKFIDEVNLNGVNDVVICPSYPYIEIYNSKSKFVVGAQNVSEKGNGATTGEVSAEQLNSFNVKYCIVGHSERRKDQKENGEMLYNKIVNLLEFNIKPIFCVGEVLEEKENGVTKDVIGKQILEVFDKLDVNKLNDIIIAYEPVWAIGTGLTPTNDEIEAAAAATLPSGLPAASIMYHFLSNSAGLAINVLMFVTSVLFNQLLIF